MRVAQVAGRDRAEAHRRPGARCSSPGRAARPPGVPSDRGVAAVRSPHASRCGGLGADAQREPGPGPRLDGARAPRAARRGARRARARSHRRQGPKSGELLQQTRDELRAAGGTGGSAVAVVGRLQLAPDAAGRPGSRGRRGGRVVPRWSSPTRIWWCGRRTRSRFRADARQLGGAIANVVRNALAYAPSGSPVKIDVDTDGERARIRVRDRGPGIPAAERHLIFDPFARGRLAAENRCGKGLGLFIARRIVEAHGGSIGLRSARPGTEFCIELPLPAGGRLRSAS